MSAVSLWLYKLSVSSNCKHINISPNNNACSILLHILVTQQVINGFFGLINRFIGQSPVTTTDTYNTSKGYGNNNTKSSTVPLLDAPCMNLVSRFIPSLLSLPCSWTGLLLLTVLSSIWSLLFCILYCGQFSPPKLASCQPDMKHCVQRYTSLFLQLTSKHVFCRSVNKPYLAIAAEPFLYTLPRNRYLCHILGDMFQQSVT
jgi:hypothetical protein